MSEVQTGPETWHAVDLAVESLARDWQEPVDGGRHELWLLACLQSSIDQRIAELVAAIPPDQREWESILSALGYDPGGPGASRRQAEIEEHIRIFTGPPEPPWQAPAGPEPAF